MNLMVKVMRQLPPRLRSVLKHETVEKRKREGGRGEREVEGEQRRNGRRGSVRMGGK